MTDVLFVEDHRTMRIVLKSYLAQQDDMQVSWEATSAEEALQILEDVTPDLVLLDVSLPEMSGLDVLAHVRDVAPDTPILVLSGHVETKYAREALDGGAMGYVVKGDMKQVPKAIRRVIRGGTFLSPQVENATK
jgi:DNA-binding NarL/FixJ family response regulator